MTVKLNLTINEATAKKAKAFAVKNHISISKLVDDYLNKLIIADAEKKSESFTKKFGGILSNPISSIDEAKSNYLKKKYGK